VRIWLHRAVDWMANTRHLLWLGSVLLFLFIVETGRRSGTTSSIIEHPEVILMAGGWWCGSIAGKNGGFDMSPKSTTLPKTILIIILTHLVYAVWRMTLEGSVS